MVDGIPAPEALTSSAACNVSSAVREHLAKYITAQMYYSLVERELEHEFVSFAEYHRIGSLYGARWLAVS